MTSDITVVSKDWARLAGIETQAATHHTESIENVRLSLKRPYSTLQQLPEFNKRKHGFPIALAAGGPSIKQTINELRQFPVIMAIGSAHDWLVENGIVPRYCVICDPDPVITATYLSKPHPQTTYLIATQCHESVFKAAEGYPVVMWHCYSGEHKELLDTEDKNWMAVAGGCTAGLRGLSIAMLLGYQNLHFFGFDSCMGISDTDHHAYEFNTKAEEVGQLYSIKIGQGVPMARTYSCSGYQLAQAVHFKQFLTQYGNNLAPTFHGDGLLTDMWEDIKSRAEKLAPQMENVA